MQSLTMIEREERGESFDTTSMKAMLEKNIIVLVKYNKLQ